MTIKRVLVAIYMVLLIISMIVIFVQFKENQRYERYISAKLSQSLSDFLTAVLVSEETLHQYMNSGKKEMLPNQATSLCYNFKSIGTEYEELLQTAKSLKKVNDVQTDQITANAAQDIHFFLARQLIGNGVLGDCTPPKSTLTLNEKQFEKIKGIYEISKQWSAIAKNLVPEATPNGVKNANWDFVVNDIVWVQLLKDYSAYANESGMTGTNQFFN
ncbi:uncharacterized protein YxeA [Paenibacillus favisporus]|uniref:Uncharacterized protein YxeA n=1 Tax=Paenibacillus favisporus TaxID=221028 RepID=A0ABV2F189_9BACL